jgi:hypothetical protein
VSVGERVLPIDEDVHLEDVDVIGGGNMATGKELRVLGGGPKGLR